jgi:tetratricopeptide (TPR) repeat protein
MRRIFNPALVLVLLLAAAFSLATFVQPRAQTWDRRGNSANVLKLVLGDSRRMFANHFFVKADVSFHSGYYPSIFDQAKPPKDSQHMTSEEGSPEQEEHERKMSFLGAPRDWIEGFGRHFFITKHTHLENGNEREILPWLKLSAELDPQRIDTYVVASYWLRNHLGKVSEAERFLREGLRNNPNSYELLYEMGCLYKENYHDLPHARHVWELALRRWHEQEPDKKDPDLIGLDKIIIHLARLEEESGNWDRAIEYLQAAMKSSSNPEALRQQIGELKTKRDAKAAKGNSGG